MQIIPNVHQLSLGMVNAYLIVEETGLTLIDTGMDKAAKRIFKAIKELGHDPIDLKHILITHTDTDHVRGARALVEASGAKVYASQIEADALGRGEASRPLKLKGVMKWIFNVVEPLMSFEALPVDEVLQAGQVLPMLGGLEVIASPGHTPEHISFYAREHGILFAGDSFRSNKDRLVTSTGVNTWDEEAAKASAALQGNLEPQIVCVGHGPVVYDPKRKLSSEIASLLRFKQHLQVLSLPAKEQLALYPDFVVKADELALDYDHWHRVVFTNYEFGFSHEQKEAADKIDEYFWFMTNMKESSLWTEEAVRTDPHWETVRDMAREALELFDWESKVLEDFVQNIYIPVRPEQG